MHPAVIAVAVSAAKGFGEGFGKELGQRLFGGKSRELSEVKKQLSEISSQLRKIDAKLDILLAAVDKLPTVIIGIFQQEIVDEAYRHIDSYYDVLRGLQDGAELSEPALSDRALMLKCWKTIVDLECRPKLLIDLPLWTTFVRTYLVVNIDATLKERLVLKGEKLKNSIDLYQGRMDTAFRRAEVILSQSFFFDSKISEVAPYFSYQVKPAPLVARTRSRGHCEGRETYYIPDPDWPQKVANEELQLSALRIEISQETTNYNAIYPVWAILNQYLPYIEGNGLVTEFNDWSAAEDEISLVPQKFRPINPCH